MLGLNGTSFPCLVYLIKSPNQLQSINLVAIVASQQSITKKNNQSKDDLRPLTQLRKTDDTQERGAAFDPGNEILDGGEGKNNMQKHFFETNTNATGTSQDNANIREQDTTRHLPGLSAPTLQTTGQPVQGESRSRHRKENKAKRRQQQSLQCNETY